MRKLKPLNDVSGQQIGYLFYCPGCRVEHLFRTVDYEIDGEQKTGWDFDGDLVAPSFTPSLVVNGEIPSERCHLILKNGYLDYMHDCFHALKNKKIPLPDVDYPTPGDVFLKNFEQTTAARLSLKSIYFFN